MARTVKKVKQATKKPAPTTKSARSPESTQPWGLLPPKNMPPLK